MAITGVTERTKKTSLQEAFGEFGRIIRIEVPNQKTVAFVEYEERFTTVCMHLLLAAQTLPSTCAGGQDATSFEQTPSN